MSDVSFWERRFVEEYIDQAKRDRYLFFLKGRKRRSKVLDRLNHALDFVPSKAILVSGSDRFQEPLVTLLKRNGVNPTCYLMADGHELDGRELRLELAVDTLLNNYWGAVLICPPKPIALYKEEDIGDMYLLGGIPPNSCKESH